MIRFVQTCEACPEQYDAFIDDQKVGYLRLRFGTFRVDVPDCGETTVYVASIGPDRMAGCFRDGHERNTHLTAAAEYIYRELGMAQGTWTVEMLDKDDKEDQE